MDRHFLWHIAKGSLKKSTARALSAATILGLIFIPLLKSHPELGNIINMLILKLVILIFIAVFLGSWLASILEGIFENRQAISKGKERQQYKETKKNTESKRESGLTEVVLALTILGLILYIASRHKKRE